MDISETIHLLGDLLGEVLIEQESRDLYAVEEHVRAQAKARPSNSPQTAEEGARALAREIAALDTDRAWVMASAFALYFDLVNTAEDNSRMNVVRQEALKKAP